MKPLMPDIGVVSPVPDEWEDVWQPRHHVLARLARYFNVTWYGPMVDRRKLREKRSSDRTPTPRPGLRIYRQDPWLPVPYRPPALVAAAERLRLRRARALARRGGAERFVFYHWRPESAAMIDRMPHDLSVYHVDDEYSFSKVERPIGDDEMRLLRESDQVFIHSPALMDKKGHVNPHTAYAPNGVDYEAYATPVAEADDLRPIPRPRIGYVGRIKPQLDLDLLDGLAVRHPDWQFVMVGPLVSRLRHGSERLDAFRGRPNVHFLGGKPVEALPAYNRHFDVSIMSYVLDDYTKFIYPMKLHEYLATGRPVVGSPIRSLQEFEGTIRLANGIDEWSAALAAALSAEDNTEQAIAARQEVARRHDWEVIVRGIAERICERLGATAHERFLRVAGEAP